MSRITEDLGDHDTAERSLRQALAILPEHPDEPRDVAAVVTTLTQLGNLARLRGRHRDAERNLRRALSLVGQGLDESDLVSRARTVLAITYKDTGRYAEAGEQYRRVLQDVLTRSGPDCAAAASIYHNLAGLAHATGNYAAAEPWARQAVRVRTRLVGDRHPDVAADLAVLAAILLEQRGLDAAARTYHRALQIYARTFGPEHYEIAVVLNGLATIACERNDPEQAERLYRRALFIKTQVLGPEHPEIAVLLNNLAVAQRRSRHPDAATASYRQALPLLERSLGPRHPTTTTCRNNLTAVTAHA